jgi:hypothetical protein
MVMSEVPVDLFSPKCFSRPRSPLRERRDIPLLDGISRISFPDV